MLNVQQKEAVHVLIISAQTNWYKPTVSYTYLHSLFLLWKSLKSRKIGSLKSILSLKSYKNFTISKDPEKSSKSTIKTKISKSTSEVGYLF